MPAALIMPTPDCGGADSKEWRLLCQSPRIPEGQLLSDPTEEENKEEASLTGKILLLDADTVISVTWIICP